MALIVGMMTVTMNGKRITAFCGLQLIGKLIDGAFLGIQLGVYLITGFPTHPQHEGN